MNIYVYLHKMICLLVSYKQATHTETKNKFSQIPSEGMNYQTLGKREVKE